MELILCELVPYFRFNTWMNVATYMNATCDTLRLSPAGCTGQLSPSVSTVKQSLEVRSSSTDSALS